jgi:hypothetical protein
MLIVRRIVMLLTLAFAGLTIYYSIVFARADILFRQNSPGSLKAAVLLVPGNAEYRVLLAEFLEGAGLNPDRELAAATEISPWESRFWIRRAFRAEVEHKLIDSERFLRKAVQVDNGFAPRAALMNYYFRRQNLPEFWKAARSALQTAYTDRRAIFRLCFAVDDNIAVTRALLPPGHRPLVELLAFLMDTGRLAQTGDIASAVASEAVPDDLNLLLGYVEQRTGTNDASAVEVWNALCARRLIPFSPLSPGKGAIVTNGDFEGNIHRGFDWKLGAAEGVAISHSYTGGESVELNAKQPESMVLMEQKIPVAAGKSYSISWQHQLDGAMGDSGLRWTVERGIIDGASGQQPIAASATLDGTTWQTGRFAFIADHSGIDRLRLEYRRVPATVRWKGTLQLRHVIAANAAGDPARSAGIP